MSMTKTRTPAPELNVATVGGGDWSLSQQANTAFTLVVFYRGYHCPKCKLYLGHLKTLLGALGDKDVGVIAVSGDPQDRAEQARSEWDLGDLMVGYGQSEDNMRAWGLYASDSIREGETDRFGEPGVFLIRPDGTLYYAAVNSNPFGRANLDEIAAMIDFVAEKDYPARGEV